MSASPPPIHPVEHGGETVLATMLDGLRAEKVELERRITIEAAAEDLVRSPAALGPNCVESGAPGAFLDLAAYGPGRPAAHCFVCLLSAHAPQVPVATSVAGTVAVVMTVTDEARCSNCQGHLLSPGAITDPPIGAGG